MAHDPAAAAAAPDDNPTPAARAPIWRSALFWRMASGAVVGFLTMLLIVGLALAVINQLVEQTTAMNTSVSSAAGVQRFSAALDTAYDTLSLVPDITYQPRFYRMEQEDLQATRQALATVEVPADQRSALVSIRNQFDALSPRLQQMNDLADKDQKAATALWQRTYGPQLDTLRQDTQGLVTSLNQDAATRQQSMSATEAASPFIIVIIGVIGLFVGSALTLLMLHQTAERISGLSADLSRLANGDLRPPHRLVLAQTPRTSFLADEVFALEQDYLKTIRTLSAPMRRIQADAIHISGAATQISAAAAQQASASNEQATAITEVTVTVEELDQTAMQIADAASSVAVAAEQALVSASRGQEAVRDSIIGMAMIRSRVNDIATRILALSAQSQRISEIIDVIDEMAARTHILALNAAVESAGAGGEVGERFGVVASEVKKLAQRSAAATREVRGIIVQVQAATNAAVMATEDGLKETEKGVGVAHQSGDANEDIIQMVERTAQLANAISLATQQQRTASEQVVATMREIAQVTRQTAVGSQQASHAATSLSDIAIELRSVSQGFEIEQAGDASSGPPEATPPLPVLPAAAEGLAG